MDDQEKDINLEEAFSNLFSGSVSGSGEEELLRIASTYSLQISSRQIRLLLYLLYRADELKSVYPESAKRLANFVDKWTHYKQWNNSDVFVMKALEYISLRKFLNENSFKVDIQK